MAEFERELIKERVKSGLDNARRKGRKLGRPAIMPVIADKVVTLRGEGLSYRAIAKQLDISASCVHKTLSKSDSVNMVFN